MNLSGRHQQILEGIAEGLTDQEIGDRHYISVDTVKSHCGTLFKRIGARNRTHAVALAYQTGLLAAPASVSDLQQAREWQRMVDALQDAERRAKYLEEQLSVALVENAAMRRDLRLREVA